MPPPPCPLAQVECDIQDMNATPQIPPDGAVDRKRLIFCFALWVVSLVALLNARSLTAPPGWDHALCGRWGCAPPLMTVVGWHGFVMVALYGPMRLLYRLFTPGRIRWVGGTFLAMGVGMVTASVVNGSRGWHGSVQGVLDFVRASLNAIVSRTDLPSLQLIILGFASIVLARKWSQAHVDKLGYKRDEPDVSTVT